MYKRTYILVQFFGCGMNIIHCELMMWKKKTSPRECERNLYEVNNSKTKSDYTIRKTTLIEKEPKFKISFWQIFLVCFEMYK